jgi:thymidylate kinase
MRHGNDRTYLKGEQDIHEANIGFQERVRQEYLSLQKVVHDLMIIDCVDSGGGMRSPQSISELIIKRMELQG